MMPVGAADTGADEAVVAGKMADGSADDGAPKTAGRIRRMRKRASRHGERRDDQCNRSLGRNKAFRV